ncbi:DNA integrity scanning protein DisA nucleotide-binding domain protein [Pyrococcus kukulkanii]|uniref:DNA integrity scanning protein DisA nucleotide-binding domain protein n=1 Tax=Pyrococcus kukulkanii TaxID=1609559 RepID=UPI00156AAB71|nr:diadenylate cyclase [Pyrococcus kukulkanii]
MVQKVETYSVLLRKAEEIAEEINAKAVVLVYPPVEDVSVVFRGPVIIVGREFDIESEDVKKLPLPLSIGLNNLLNLVAAFLKGQGIIKKGELFVYVTEDSLGIKRVEERSIVSNELFDRYEGIVQRALEIAIELSIEGREGKPVGTIFVIGDTKEVMKHSHQIVPNPFKGHNLNILDPKVKPIIKEFSFLDGAFIITSKGRILAAGRYLDVDPKSLEVTLPQGLGSRHLASAAITKVTKAIAITLSESGTVRVFKDGQIVLEYNPRLSARSL